MIIITKEGFIKLTLARFNMIRFVVIAGSNHDDLVRRSIDNLLKDSIGIVARTSLDRKLKRELQIQGSLIIDVTEDIQFGFRYKDIIPLKERYGSSIYVEYGGYINLRGEVVGLSSYPQHSNGIENDFDFPHLEIPQIENNFNTLKPAYTN